MIKEDRIREQKDRFCSLFRIYGNRLTETIHRRREYFYLEDYSLSEISQIEKVSRNAVFLSLSQGKKELENREEKLGFLSKLDRIRDGLEELKEAKDSEKKEELISKIEGEIDYGI